MKLFFNKTVFLFLLIFSSTCFSQVVLSEIMFDPIGSEHTDEFVEIYNFSEYDVINLDGWKLGDGNGEDFIIGAGEGLILEPHQYGIILDADYFEQSTWYDVLIPEEALVLTVDGTTLGSGGLLNSQSEQIMVFNRSEDLVAQYAYTIGNQSGYSEEKIDLGRMDDSENWADSQCLNGTPGYRNSVAGLTKNLSISRLWMEPEHPREGTDVSIQATVCNSGKEEVMFDNVSLFEDVNIDSNLQEGEAIGHYTSSEPILPGDSLIVLWKMSNMRGGYIRLGVYVQYEEDERPDDNVFIKEFMIGYHTENMVINEIMADPSPNQCEWIELYNKSISTMDLRGWTISDADTATLHPLTGESIYVQSHSYIVISNDSSILDVYPGVEDCLIVCSLPGLNNQTDGVVLYEPAKQIIDQVYYRESWGGGDGFSLERINPDVEISDSTNWHGCVSLEGATPGQVNSVFTDLSQSDATLTASPNPFSPDDDGFDDVVFIQYQLTIIPSSVHLRIYDVRGRRIRTLIGARGSGVDNVVVWDGRDDQGQAARIGIYIIHLEALDQKGGVVKSSKATLVLAGKL